MQRKLIVDGSSLWDDPEDQFVLRFNDLNQRKQNKLAQRIKQTSSRQRIRNETGPTVEKIVSLLKEINPIIHAEGSKIAQHAQWTRWNDTKIRTLSGWYYRNLDKLIYRFLCLNRPPSYEEISNALYLSIKGINNHGLISYGDAIRQILGQLPQENNEMPAPAVPAEIGISDVQYARERTERRNN